MFRRTNTAVPKTIAGTQATWETYWPTIPAWRSLRTRTRSYRWSAPTTSWDGPSSCTPTTTTWDAEDSPTAWPPGTRVPGWRAASSESCRHTRLSKRYWNPYGNPPLPPPHGTALAFPLPKLHIYNLFIHLVTVYRVRPEYIITFDGYNEIIHIAYRVRFVFNWYNSSRPHLYYILIGFFFSFSIVLSHHY